MLFILKYIHLFRSLSGPAHSAILLAALVSPLAVDFGVDFFRFGWCWHWSCLEWTRIATHLGMWLVSVAIIALAGNVDKSRLDKKLSVMSSQLNDSIGLLREDHERKITGTQRHISDLDEWVTAIYHALSEQGVGLPARMRSADADGVRWSVSIGEAEGEGHPRNILASFRLWVGCQADGLRRWFRKWILAKDCDGA